MTRSIEAIRDKIITFALPHVPEKGWTWSVVQAACMDASYQQSMARSVFQEGITDAVAHFSDMMDRKMLVALEKTDPDSMKVRARIQAAVMARFHQMKPYREAARLALAFWTVPPRGMVAGRVLWRTADRIWNWAGDTAQDHNKQTKRSLLIGVMGASMMVWLTDQSENLAETEAFVNRRIENVLEFGQLISKVKNRS